MEIGRRALLTGFAATAAAALVPTLPAGASALSESPITPDIDGLMVANLLLIGTVYRQVKPVFHLSFSLRICDVLVNSLWQYDNYSYENRPIIRHCPSGFTYVASSEGVGLIAVRRVAECCCLNEQRYTHREVTVGHVARCLAVRASRMESVFHREGAVFLSYPDIQSVLHWPTCNPTIDAAPPIRLKRLTDPALIAKADYAPDPILDS